MANKSAHPDKRAMPTGPAWVYALRNVQTGERLFGGAAHVLRAWRRHRRRLHAGIHTNLALQEAWEEQGGGTFILEFVEEVADGSALAGRVRAWVAQEPGSYNTHWQPRLRPRTVMYRQGDEMKALVVYPPAIIHRMDLEEDPADPDAPTAPDPATGSDLGNPGSQDQPSPAASPSSQPPIIVARTTYRLPCAARDLPLLIAANGTAYVPVEAWCAVLGVRLSTHLWRLRRMLLWADAREIPCDLGEHAADSAGALGASGKPEESARKALPVPTPQRSSHSVPPIAPPIRPSRQARSAHKPQDHRGEHTVVPVTVPAPVWCLPRERFLMFTFCVGWKRINPALYPALKAMGEAERVEDERRSREYAERVRAYEETRQQAIRLLMNCDQLNHLLETLDREMATVLTVVEGTDLMALCARGRTVIRTAAEAARKALRQLRTGGITEYTSYDPQVDAMRTRIIPNHPTLPNPATMVALDEGESAFLTWVAPFLLYLQRHFADTDGA